MRQTVLLTLTLGALAACNPRVWAAEPNSEQAKAVAQIEKLGGKVEIDKKNPGDPAISVKLSFCQLSDASLKDLAKCLKGLTQLRRLDLSFSRVTDAGLVHVKGLTQLRALSLYRSVVTDAGLVHLKGLTQLQDLDLGETEITDAGRCRTTLPLAWSQSLSVNVARLRRRARRLPESRLLTPGQWCYRRARRLAGKILRRMKLISG